ncbi:unnamed protein product [Phytomonas sp. Hart1]|nr:unnamed protein product [Phytomonas sp. Hart1]|eukprot:CCW67606.1 unnamed protein product [Phytomonas sp. isolate Hart1]
MQENRIVKLFGIKYPIIQAGMIWCSGWRLASAVSNAGGLGLIGAGSMNIDVFKENIQKCKIATSKPFGVNLPLSHNANIYIEHILEEKIPIVFTSAGSPKVWTKTFKDHGIKVVHVVPSSKLALKCQDAGVDAVVAEGFEAGGHNGLEEITTMTLIPQVRRNLSPDIPLIAAGGIASGDSIFAVMALGAEGAQLGTRFALTKESACSEAFKKYASEAQEGDTVLTLKKLMPTRLLLNKYGKEIQNISISGATKQQLEEFRGRGRTRQGMFDGDTENGELEIGQIASYCRDIPSVEELMLRLVEEFNNTNARLSHLKIE